MTPPPAWFVSACRAVRMSGAPVITTTAAFSALGIAGVLALVAATPNTAAACCADVDAATPLGWSADGELLVSRSVGTACSGSLVAEVVAPGEESPRERFDLYDGGRPLSLDETPRELDVEALFQAEQAAEAAGELPPFQPPEALARRFVHSARSLCAAGVLVRATPNAADPPDAEGWEQTVRLSVAVRSPDAPDGFHEVLRDVILPRGWIQDASVRVHPSPRGDDAVVRFHSDGPDLLVDSNHWVELPFVPDEPHGVCDEAAVIIPDPGMPRRMEDDDVAWRLEMGLDALGEAAGGRNPLAAQLALLNLNDALWLRPDDPDLRSQVASVLDLLEYHHVAGEVRQGLDLGPAEGDVRLWPVDAGASPPARATAPATSSPQLLACSVRGPMGSAPTSEAARALPMVLGLVILVLGVKPRGRRRSSSTADPASARVPRPEQSAQPFHRSGSGSSAYVRTSSSW